MTEALETTTTTTAEDLRELGFTEQQIDALILLRERCPLIEFCDSEIELQRMRFLKWRVVNGDLDDGIKRFGSPITRE